MTPPTKTVNKGFWEEPLWLEWMAYRKSRRKKNTDRAKNMLLNELRRISDYGITATDAITEALNKEWIGIKLEWLEAYKLKEVGHEKTSGHSTKLSRAKAAIQRNRDANISGIRGVNARNVV